VGKSENYFSKWQAIDDDIEKYMRLSVQTIWLLKRIYIIFVSPSLKNFVSRIYWNS